MTLKIFMLYLCYELIRTQGEIWEISLQKLNIKRFVLFCWPIRTILANT